MPTQKLMKKAETIAEKAGLPSVEEKVKEIEAVKAQDVPVPEKRERKKRILSEEQKEVLRERLKKARAARSEKRASQKKID